MEHFKRRIKFNSGKGTKRMKLERVDIVTYYQEPGFNVNCDIGESTDSFNKIEKGNTIEEHAEEELQQKQAFLEGVFNKLPCEIMSLIFKFLERKELLQASCVCKLWRTVIFSTAAIWQSKLLRIKCSDRKNIANFGLYCGRVGKFLRSLRIRFLHRKHSQCRKAAGLLRRYLKYVQTQSLHTFHLSNLRISPGIETRIKPIASCVSRIISTQRKLTTFNVSRCCWPGEIGLSILICLGEKFHNTLQNLRIDGFFDRTFSPVSDQRFFNVITSFTVLKSLSISYSYLNDEIVKALITPKRLHFKRMELFARDIHPMTSFISSSIWTYLMNSYPSLKIEFRIDGYVHQPSVTIPAILDPAMRINKLDIDIYCRARRRRQHIPYIIRYITSRFRKRLKSFKLNVDNIRESVDCDLIRMVRRCKCLVQVRIAAHFSNYRNTMTIIKRMIRERRERMDEHRRIKNDRRDGTSTSSSSPTSAERNDEGRDVDDNNGDDDGANNVHVDNDGNGGNAVAGMEERDDGNIGDDEDDDGDDYNEEEEENGFNAGIGEIAHQYYNNFVYAIVGSNDDGAADVEDNIDDDNRDDEQRAVVGDQDNGDG